MIYRHNQYTKHKNRCWLVLDMGNETFNITLLHILYFWINKAKQNAGLDDIFVSVKKKTVKVHFVTEPQAS